MSRSLCVPLVMACIACPSGRDLPTETAEITVAGGTFTLGPNTPDGRPPACGGVNDVEIHRCDSGRQTTDPAAWIEDLTWVPPAAATVSSFVIDEHEVTNLQYAYCVERGECSPPLNQEIDGQPYYGVAGHENSPVVWVTHGQAMEYCASLGKRLPNEAEWEWAARVAEGGALRTYPWEGLEPSNCIAGSAHYLLTKGCKSLPAPVGYSDADRTFSGVRDMGSNVSEWVLDGWHRYAYCEARQGYRESCQLQGVACPDCQADGSLCAKSCDENALVICLAGTYAPYVGNTSEWVVRGGSWNHGACYNRLYVRRRESQARPEIGFRCAK